MLSNYNLQPNQNATKTQLINNVISKLTITVLKGILMQNWFALVGEHIIALIIYIQLPATYKAYFWYN